MKKIRWKKKTAIILSAAVICVFAVTLALRLIPGSPFAKARVGTPVVSEAEILELLDQAGISNAHLGSYDTEPTARGVYAKTVPGETKWVSYTRGGKEYLYIGTPFVLIDANSTISTRGTLPFRAYLYLAEVAFVRSVGAAEWTQRTDDYKKHFVIDNVSMTWDDGENTEFIDHTASFQRYKKDGPNWKQEDWYQFKDSVYHDQDLVSFAFEDKAFIQEGSRLNTGFHGDSFMLEVQVMASNEEHCGETAAVISWSYDLTVNNGAEKQTETCTGTYTFGYTTVF